MNMRLALTLGWRTVLIGFSLLSLSWPEVSPISAQQVTTEWTKPVSLSLSPDLFSAVPLINCDKYQNLHVFYVDRQENSYSVNYRDDVSGTWSVPNDILQVKTIFDLTSAITPNDTVHLMWVSGPVGNLAYSQAPLYNAGNAKYWQEPRLLSKTVSDVDLFANQTAALYAIYNFTSPAALTHSLTLIQSADNGQTWTAPNALLTFTTPLPSLVSVRGAVDGRGRIHIAYTIRSYDYAAYSRASYVRSTDDGQTWTAPLILGVGEQRPGTAQLNVYVFGDDEVHLTWDAPARLHQWSLDGGATWSQPITIDQLGAAFGGANELVKDSADILHAVFAVRGGVFHSTWDGSIWAAPETIDDRLIDPHQQHIVVCQGNQLHVVYRDNEVGHSEIWYSTKQIEAPHLQRSPIPDAQPQLRSTLIPGSIPAASVNADGANASAATSANDVFTPILIGILIAVSGFSFLFVIHAKRRNT